jgi:predicted dehydrogenase
MSSTRRGFLRQAAGTGLAASVLSAEAPAQGTRFSSNDMIQVAQIGCGIMGQGDARTSSSIPGVKLAAACDIYDGRLTHMKEVHGKDVFTTRDYREVLSRQDIDAVYIATPDHWHQKIAIDAMNAGKDVYCQKPMVKEISEGNAVIAAKKKTGRVFQVGSQRVSSVVYQKAKDLYRSGLVGELNMVEAWVDRNSATGAWQYSIPPDASPENIDWDRFLGNAPKAPFEPVRLFRWRNYRDYGTGVAGDLFVHLFSGIHFVLDSHGPTRIFATGGLRFWKDGRDVPDVMLGLFDYPATDTHPAFNLALRVNFAAGGGGSSEFHFIGSEGVLTIGRGVSVSKTPREEAPGFTVSTFSKAMQEEFLKEYYRKYPPKAVTADEIEPEKELKYEPPRGYSDQVDHHRNFIAAVRSRKPVVEDATFGFRAAAPAIACNMSYFKQRIVSWNPENMTEES